MPWTAIARALRIRNCEREPQRPRGLVGFFSFTIVTNKSNYVMADEVALADISNPIRSQSDSTPFTVSLSRQPCNIMRPVAFALKILLYRWWTCQHCAKAQVYYVVGCRYTHPGDPEHVQVSFIVRLISSKLNRNSDPVDLHPDHGPSASFARSTSCT